MEIVDALSGVDMNDVFGDGFGWRTMWKRLTWQARGEIVEKEGVSRGIREGKVVDKGKLRTGKLRTWQVLDHK